MSLSEEELLSMPLYEKVPDMNEVGSVFSVLKDLSSEMDEADFAKSLIPRVRYMTDQEKREMTEAIREGLSFADILRMSELSAEDMLAFRLKKLGETGAA